MDQQTRRRIARLLRDYRRTIARYRRQVQAQTGLEQDLARRMLRLYEAGLDGAREMLETVRE